MDERLAQRSCEEFTALLASSAPTPGGGGAAALMGALSASLCSMAAHLSRNKTCCAAWAQSLAEIAELAEGLRCAQLEQIDADAEAFAPLARAYRLPKDDPETAAVMETALLGACSAPLAMLRLCVQTIPLLERLLEQASPLMLSDVGCAAESCRAALECAAMNLWVNTASLPEERVRDMEQECGAARADALPRIEAVSTAVREKLVRR